MSLWVGVPNEICWQGREGDLHPLLITPECLLSGEAVSPHDGCQQKPSKSVIFQGKGKESSTY